jgi:aspartyl-tRNA(Asn)/glutamyl-tRNA(Gln) amidotransferase subunit A
MNNHNPAPRRLSIDQLVNKIHAGALSYSALIEQCLQEAQKENAAHVFTKTYHPSALAVAHHADAQLKAGVTLPYLAGLPISIKDLYDVSGEVTTSGSLVRRGCKPANSDALIVKRIRESGMAIVGKTNMSEFAFSGVGINPHLGTPQNPCDPVNHRIPGGSSSGAAVSVALGLSVAAIGSDTGGSIRIPAALCGLVGFKSTMNRVPTQGAVELSRSLDTVCAMTTSVSDCLSIDAVLSGARLDVKARYLKGARFAISKTMMQDDLEPAVAKAFERTLSLLSGKGAVITEIELSELNEIAQINAPGGLSPIESYAACKEFVDHESHQMDHRVLQRMMLGKGVSAADYIKLLDNRQDWIKRTSRVLAPFDALISPTVPMQAPKTQPLMDSDEEFFRVNRLLLRNTFAINFLDGCAFSLPMQIEDELPMGLMLSASAGLDARLAEIALGTEWALGHTAPKLL